MTGMEQAGEISRRNGVREVTAPDQAFWAFPLMRAGLGKECCEVTYVENRLTGTSVDMRRPVRRLAVIQARDDGGRTKAIAEGVAGNGQTLDLF